MSPLTVQSTPNPNSVKLSQQDRRFADGMYSFDSPAEAEDHPLGRALFHVEGIDNVFIVPDFVTITKTAEADWDEILPTVKRILRDAQDE